MADSRIPANLITGAMGAGKTTLITHLLKQRPAAERWAVLVNDFGRTTLRAAPASIDGDIVVREVAGCICCTGQVALRTALVSLLRDARPQRLLIEASAAAHAGSIRRVLDEPGLAKAVELRSNVCVVDAQQVADPRYLASDVYREQLAAADVIVLGGTGAVGRDAYAAGLARLTGLRATTARVIDAADAWERLDLL